MNLLDKLRHSIISIFEPLNDEKLLKDYILCDKLLDNRKFEEVLEILDSIRVVQQRKLDRNEKAIPTMGELQISIELLKEYIDKL